MGLPQKAAVNAGIIKPASAQYFYTSLDAFQGNSGSPVFSRKTGQVIGVLVSGQVDYVWRGGCNESFICRLPYCEGEKAMRLDSFIKSIPE